MKYFPFHSNNVIDLIINGFIDFRKIKNSRDTNNMEKGWKMLLEYINIEHKMYNKRREPTRSHQAVPI